MFVMKNFRKSIMPALLGIAFVLAGCASSPSTELAQDRGLCKQARVERAKGDPQWIRSLEAIRDPYVACIAFRTKWPGTAEIIRASDLLAASAV